MILNMTEEYEKKNRYVPKFDEILFLGAIPPQNIERIGTMGSWHFYTA
jgi:hypothetical protein